MIVERFKASVLASLLAALVFAGLSPTVATAADGHFFVLSTNSARPGYAVEVTQQDACPAIPAGVEYQEVWVSFTDSSGIAAEPSLVAGTDDQGTWVGAGGFVVPYRSLGPIYFDAAHFTHEATEGPANVSVKCVLPDGTVSQTYTPQPFNVTGKSNRLSGPSEAQSGSTVHIASVDPCPGDRVAVSIISGLAVSNFTATPDGSGAWSADVPASSENMDGSRTPFPAGTYAMRAYCMTDATAETHFRYADELISVTGDSGGVTCKDALFIAVTGSGEHYDGDANLTVSPTLRKVYNGFSAVYPTDKSLGIKVLDYPALPVDVLFQKLNGSIPNKAVRLFRQNLPTYLAGKDAGVGALSEAVNNARSACPNQAIVLAGYSQGAMVIHQYLSEFAGSPIAATVLIADPMRVADSGAFNFGDAASSSTGICKYVGAAVNCNNGNPVRDIPQPYRKSTTQVCNQYDAVCDTPTMVDTFWPIGFEQMYQTGSMVHTTYSADQMTKLAGKRAARQVMNGG